MLNPRELKKSSQNLGILVSPAMLLPLVRNNLAVAFHLLWHFRFSIRPHKPLINAIVTRQSPTNSVPPEQ